ncbi:MAG TPA: 4-hydroxybenzoate 3-monooxygenase [Geminicoccaceae bacterium]
MTVSSRTQVAIIGAGPAGLLLGHLLHQAGIESVILERHDRAYVESRIRAGVLEHGTVELLEQIGCAGRLHREGLVHGGIELSFGGARHRIDFPALTGGRTITVYGQHEVVKDLIAARLAHGGEIRFEAEAVALEDLETARPRVRFREHGADRELVADVIAGCDGFRGIARPSIAEQGLRAFEREYPFGWLGILAQARPISEELIYARHEDGFALFSMRSPEVSRLYLQCAPDEDLEAWPDERIWAALARRLGEGAAALETGPVLQKGVTAMRSFVASPMRHHRLFLAGDAAHIVPPTGAKGMNLAAADVRVLAHALIGFFDAGRTAGLDAYSDTCLRRVWKVQRFSWWMTSLLHRFPDEDAFARRIQLAELDYLVTSRAASTALAENYVGLPLEGV